MCLSLLFFFGITYSIAIQPMRIWCKVNRRKPAELFLEYISCIVLKNLKKKKNYSCCLEKRRRRRRRKHLLEEKWVTWQTGIPLVANSCLRNHTWTWLRERGLPFCPLVSSNQPWWPSWTAAVKELQTWRFVGQRGGGSIPQTRGKEFTRAA